MIRRNFLKAVAFTPFAGLLCRKSRAEVVAPVTFLPQSYPYRQFRYLSEKYPGNFGVVICTAFKELKDEMFRFANFSGGKIDFSGSFVSFGNGSVIMFATASQAWQRCNNIELGWFYLAKDDKLNCLVARMRSRLRRKGVPHCHITLHETITWL